MRRTGRERRTGAPYRKDAAGNNRGWGIYGISDQTNEPAVDTMLKLERALHERVKMLRPEYDWMRSGETRFHEPLADGDSETQTVGCRHSKPDNCRNNGLAGKCAFPRPDNMCLLPPRSWPQKFQKLVANKDSE